MTIYWLGFETIAKCKATFGPSCTLLKFGPPLHASTEHIWRNLNAPTSRPPLPSPRHAFPVAIINNYSTFHFFCRDISCYNSIVFKALKLKLDTKSVCWMSKIIEMERLKGTFFFAPIKWATSGLVWSAQNWFQSKRYVINIIRKNSQPKNPIFTTL